MNRLTIQYNEEWVPRESCTIDRHGGADDCEICGEICEKQEVSCKECHIQKCFERLAAYEDTGLEPNQIIEMDKLYLKKCEEVNKLLAELQERKEGNWISVKDRLPEELEIVLVKGKSRNDLRKGYDATWICYDCWVSSCVENITHWMALPEPPKDPQLLEHANNQVEQDGSVKDKLSEWIKKADKLIYCGIMPDYEKKPEQKPLTYYDKLMQDMTPDRLIWMILSKCCPCVSLGCGEGMKCEKASCRECALERLQQERKE